MKNYTKNNQSKIKKIMDITWIAAIVYLTVWSGITIGYFYFSTKLNGNLIAFIMGCMLLYPIAFLVVSFLYAKNYGLRWYFILAIAIIVAIEYFLLDFKIIKPNYIVMAIVTVFFGSAFGSLLSDKIKIIGREDNTNASKSVKIQAENKYKSIIDDKK